MADGFGNHLRVSLFGESHGPAVGVTVEGLPAGLRPDFELIAQEMARRAPGQSAMTTARKEADEVEVLSGIYNGKLTGTALTAIIRNLGQHSRDYASEMDEPRPGHADYTGHVRYHGHEDPRGGGHFSARITAGLVFAGALTKQWLKEFGIEITSRIVRIGNVTGSEFNDEMRAEITSAKEALDSVGGVVECKISGLPAGLGAPFFDSAESVIAHVLFSVPGVKGVEFGLGFGMGALRGSDCNDEMTMVNGKISHKTNRSGGILGGITNGEDVIFRAALRPTPSVAKTQQSVSLREGIDKEINIHGRHDPCIVIRALPVIESVAALAVGELWKERMTW